MLLNATNLGAFTVTSEAVDVMGGNAYSYLCSSLASENGADLDGRNGTAGQFSSAILSLAPRAFTLSFDLLGSQRGMPTTTTVALDSLCGETYSLGSADLTSGVVSTTINARTANDVALIITSKTAGNAGAVLDNVNPSGCSGFDR